MRTDMLNLSQPKRSPILLNEVVPGLVEFEWRSPA